MAIGNTEAYVCRLESILDMRQAYIPQHLLGLREAGILTARRDGKYIFYRVRDQQVVDLINENMTGAILIGLACCIAMVIIWNELAIAVAVSVFGIQSGQAFAAGSIH